MAFENLILPIALSVGGASAITFAAWKLFNRYYVSVAPNQALVLFGRRWSGPSAVPGGHGGAVEFRPPRILVGGGAYLPPWRTGAGYLSLEPIDVDVTVRVSSAAGDPTFVGWEARVALQVKIPAEPAMLRAAAENILGRNEEEIRRLVGRTVQAAAPPLLARLAPADGVVDWERLGTEIQASTARDLVANGLAIRSLTLTELRRLSGPMWTGRAPVALPSPDIVWSPDDASSRLGSLESPYGASGADRSGSAGGFGRSAAAASPAGPTAGPYFQDSTGRDLRSPRPKGPVNRGPRGWADGRRPPLDVEQRRG